MDPVQPPGRHRLRSDPCGRKGQVPAGRLTAAPMSASIRGTGASRHCGSPARRRSAACSGLIPRFPNLAEYEKAALGAVDIKVIILKCELHTGNGFVAAEGTGARRVDQDRGDINKSLKMAVKSAHIDATLRVAGLSELFSQDIEDMLQDKAGKGDVPAGDGNNNHHITASAAPTGPNTSSATEGACNQRPEPRPPTAGATNQTASPPSSTASSWTC